MNLNEKALLVKATVHRIGLEAKDKKSAMEIAQKHNIDSSLLNFKKSKFLKEDISEVTKAVNKVTPLINYYTVPWRDGGWRMITTEMYSELEEKLRELTNEIETAKQNLINNLELYKRNMQDKMNSLFNLDDYPTKEEINRKIGIDVYFEPIPTSGDIRVDMPKDIIDNLKNKMEENMNDRIKVVMSEVWNRTIENINHLKDRLETYSNHVENEKEGRTPKLYDSLIEHIKNLVKMLPSMNITGDPKLEEVRQKLESDFIGLSINELKESDSLRHNIINKAESIIGNLEGIM